MTVSSGPRSAAGAGESEMIATTGKEAVAVTPVGLFVSAAASAAALASSAGVRVAVGGSFKVGAGVGEGALRGMGLGSSQVPTDGGAAASLFRLELPISQASQAKEW
eukprot:CAMPEP_0206534360 /NCGR_PEP_ID=MMETSP0325_2-20121206/5503_1 /ASSEMBLY_ACC=CAM_ASM_000347 /TAXON_ID=2866 /ORGANISM="Crypthecodinium cohnii, Strain Seligo" /LENGTH=106 /DNA_ID=CAMNT_0054031157 /DNA_START=1283 /DNA_END=1604 /DNA_ORIENTATION=+